MELRPLGSSGSNVAAPGLGRTRTTPPGRPLSTFDDSESAATVQAALNAGMARPNWRLQRHGRLFRKYMHAGGS